MLTEASARSSMTSSRGVLMPEGDIDLLAIDRGTVTAPAGCGKTHLIGEALTRHTGSKPILVLTHTNAGVAALRGRLDRACVRAGAYRLSTIDGRAMRLDDPFPMRRAHDPMAVDHCGCRSARPLASRCAREARAWRIRRSAHRTCRCHLGRTGWDGGLSKTTGRCESAPTGL